MANYRIIVSGAIATEKSHIDFAISLEKETGPGVWTPVPGPSTLSLPLSQVLGPLRWKGTDTERRQALLHLIRQAARSDPQIMGARIIDRIDALLPVGWPQTVNL